MSLIRQLAGHTVVYGLGHILSKILYFVVLTTYLTNRFPDTKDYGLYAEMYAYASLILVILSYRIDTAFFRFGSKDSMLNKAFSSAFIPLIGTTIILVSLCVMSSDLIANLIGYPDRPQYVIWFACILGFDALALLPYAKLRLQNKAMLFIGFRIVNIIITILLIFFFLEFYSENSSSWLSTFIPSVNTEIEYVFISNLIASAFILVSILYFTARVKWEVDWLLWKRMVLYALPLIVVGIAGSFNQFFAVPLQKFLLGSSFDENLTQAGIYAAPQRIAALLALFTTAFNYAAEPFFFNNAERQESKKLYGRICLLFTMIGGLAVLGVIYFIDLFQFLVGANYREGMVIVPILLFAYLLLGIYYNISIWYKLADKTLYGALISTIGAAVTFTMSFFLLPEIGYIASAWAALATYLVMNILVYYFGQRYYPIDYPIKKIMIMGIILIVFSYFGLLLSDMSNIIISYSLKVGLLIIYLSIIYRMDRQSFGELLSKFR